MKKILSLFLATVMLIISFSVLSSATEILPDETEEPYCRYMGDNDGDGQVTAMEARQILRFSVGLENFYPYHVSYIDMDYDGKIGASDARLALRTSVGLEKLQSHDFMKHDIVLPSCTKNGHLESTCAHCGLEVSVDIPKDRHNLVSHQCDSLSLCVGCGQMVPTGVPHEYEAYICFKCGKKDTAGFYNALAKYVKTNGIYEEGVYYIEETVDYETFSLCYDTSDNSMYGFAGTAYEAEDGQIVYYFNYIEFDSGFSTYSVELDCYVEDTFVAYALYDMDPAKLNSITPGALTLTEFDSIPELAGMQAEFELISEGLSYDTVNWIDSVVKKVLKCDASRIMGFVEM